MCIFYPGSLNDNILYNHSALSKPGDWHLYNTIDYTTDFVLILPVYK